MTDPDLTNCPFCNDEAEFVEQIDRSGRPYWDVCCRGCTARTSGDSKLSAAMQWLHRTSMSGLGSHDERSAAGFEAGQAPMTDAKGTAFAAAIEAAADHQRRVAKIAKEMGTYTRSFPPACSASIGDREMEMEVDLTKKYRARNGMHVQLISDQGHPDYPILGYVNRTRAPQAWRKNGAMYGDLTSDGAYDLVEIPSTLTFEKWLVIAVERTGLKEQSRILRKFLAEAAKGAEMTRAPIIERGDILFVASDERRAKAEVSRYRSTGNVECVVRRVAFDFTEREITEWPST